MTGFHACNHSAALAAVACLLACSVATPHLSSRQTAATIEVDPGWHLLGRGMTRGISGLALLDLEPDAVSFLAVLDNKGPNEPRLMRLIARAGQPLESRDLAWPSPNPPKRS